MFGGFRKFIMRGNVVDLAVAVVIGGAFTLVVNSLVDDVINPILAAIVGKPDFSDLTITIRDSTIMYGSFITAIINFLLVAAAIYFFIIVPMNRMTARLQAGQGTPDPDTKQCPECRQHHTDRRHPLCILRHLPGGQIVAGCSCADGVDPESGQFEGETRPRHSPRPRFDSNRFCLRSRDSGPRHPLTCTVRRGQPVAPSGRGERSVTSITLPSPSVTRMRIL